MRSIVVAYRHARLLLAAGAMLLILYAAIRAIVAGASVSDVGVPVVLALAPFAFFGFRHFRRTKAIQEQAAFEELARRVAAKRAAREPKRITGARCAGCARRIVIEADGRHCVVCNEPVHNGCVGAHSSTAHAVEAYR
ncbi:MAG TPA: hypothetical protein VF765_30750 [Polyangiaceae bacterium]